MKKTIISLLAFSILSISNISFAQSLITDENQINSAITAGCYNHAVSPVTFTKSCDAPAGYGPIAVSMANGQCYFSPSASGPYLGLMPSNGNQRHGIKLWVRDATCEGEADVPGEGAGDLAGILAGLPDQIMAVLLAFLCFKTFLEMVK